MAKTRTENAARNVSAALIGQILNIVLNFVCRTIFIYTLGKTYLGVSGLFSNILSIMSLAELGIGEAIVFKMYKPVAEKNVELIKTYMNFYKKAYWLIGSLIFIVGLILIPFLSYLVKGGEGIENISFIYVLYLFNTASTYFFAYKKLIINTDQKGYIDTINRYLFLTLQNCFQIVVLLLFKNFILYLCIQIVLNFLANVNIARIATKMYPYLNGKAQPVSKEDRKEIFKQTSALVVHKIGGVCVSGTDNLLLSTFIGINWVGIYSNYVTILAIPQTMLAYVFSPLTASIGNLVSTSEKEHIKSTFNKLFLVNFWLYGVCSICLFVLLNDFIGKIWIDDSYLLSTPIVFVVVFNFYLTGMRQTVSAFKSTSGLFWNDRFRPLAEALVNLVVSIILLKVFGFIGVILGTTISTLTTTFWVEGVIVYKHVLDERISAFFTKYFIYMITVLGSGALTYYLCSFVQVNGFFAFVLKAVICFLLCNALFFVIFGRTEEMKMVWRQYIKPWSKKLVRK